MRSFLRSFSIGSTNSPPTAPSNTDTNTTISNSTTVHSRPTTPIAYQPSMSLSAPDSPNVLQHRGPSSSFGLEVSELCNEVKNLKDRIHALKIQQNQAHSEETSCMNDLSKKWQQLSELGQYLGNTTDLDEKKEGKLRLLNVKNDLEALDRLFPRPPHFMLRLSLGSANFCLPEAQKIRYKTEYEAFKLHCTVYNFIFSLVNLYLFSFFLDLLQYFFLLYFYCSMTVREHILQVNGSRIRAWWFIHHYLSILLTGTVLIWPFSESLNAYRFPFLYYNLYLSAVQYLQYRYQMNRLYTLRALSKIGPMDITTDSAQVHVRNNLTFLLPFLLIAHLLQYYHAYLLWLIWSNPGTLEWQPIVIAILYCLLATGNLTVTLYTYFQKLHRTTGGRGILNDE